MAYRVVSYEQAFGEVLGMEITPQIRAFLKGMEEAGHTEKSICFTIWKKQDKMKVFKLDSRFLSVLKNEVNKWSWKKDDPRWAEYWKRKNEEVRAAKMRKELDDIRKDEDALADAGKSRKRHKGYVYFIQGQCGGAIKIGYSVNPEKRLKELQTGYPDTLVMLLMIPGSEATERALHRQFEASRLKGEWFRPDDYVVKVIKELATRQKGVK